MKPRRPRGTRSKEVQTNNNHNNHNRVGQLPGFWSLGLGGSGSFGFRKFGQNTKTLKLAKVGLAKVGQHLKTLKLAKVGLAKVRQDHDWPKSVKNLAKVGLAKVGLAKVGHDRWAVSEPRTSRRREPVGVEIGIQGDRSLWTARQQLTRPKAVIGRVISCLGDRWPCLFEPPFCRDNMMLVIFAFLVGP